MPHLLNDRKARQCVIQHTFRRNLLTSLRGIPASCRTLDNHTHGIPELRTDVTNDHLAVVMKTRLLQWKVQQCLTHRQTWLISVHSVPYVTSSELISRAVTRRNQNSQRTAPYMTHAGNFCASWIVWSWPLIFWPQNKWVSRTHGGPCLCQVWWFPASSFFYPHMPLGKVYFISSIVCSFVCSFVCLFVCLLVCLFVRLRISLPRIKLASSNSAWSFIGVQGKESPFLWILLPQKAQNLTHRPARGARPPGCKHYRTDAPT